MPSTSAGIEPPTSSIEGQHYTNYAIEGDKFVDKTCRNFVSNILTTFMGLIRLMIQMYTVYTLTHNRTLQKTASYCSYTIYTTRSFLSLNVALQQAYIRPTIQYQYAQSAVFFVVSLNKMLITAQRHFRKEYGRKYTICENDQRVLLNAVRKKSTRLFSIELGVYNVYEVQIMQVLFPDDRPRSTAFAADILERIEQHSDYLKQVCFFSDEAICHIFEKATDTMFEFGDRKSDVLVKTWHENRYQLNVLRITNGAHIEVNA
ncbi:hypothetical protein ANN_01442 [Periplaneta americana]|uniref:Uncharacterized protein n=1 Tax=Periplaneta americana TaxID=6978 RepID=A0ABQ8TWK3_PERAM|nr:hypothetical protein ANN_01442 [Periplaneta americana]